MISSQVICEHLSDDRTRCLPVEVSFDALLDQPERMMGLVVEVAAHLFQDLWSDVGEVITQV